MYNIATVFISIRSFTASGLRFRIPLSGAFILLASAIILLTGCSAEKFLAPDEQLLTSVKLSSDNSAVDPSAYNLYVRQKPNTKWFNLLKVPLGIYCLSSADSTKSHNSFWQRIGEAPVIYSEQQTINTQNAIVLALKDKGYLHAVVKADVSPSRGKHKTKVRYDIHAGQLYTISNITYTTDNTEIDSLINLSIVDSYLHKGMPCDVSLLDKERTRITAMLHNHGYYNVLKTFIHYDIDTLAGPSSVSIHLHYDGLTQSKDSSNTYSVYHLRNVNIASIDTTANLLRRSLLRSKTHLRSGNLYREQDVNRTYLALSNLDAINYVAIQIHDVSEVGEPLLDCDISILPEKANTLGAEIEGTNTAGNLGVAANLTYTNRNLFHGSEVWTTKLKGAYEAITGLEGYSNQNYVELGVETKLTFPKLVMPFVSQRHPMLREAARTATTSLSLRFDTQDRPEFHRRVLTALWNYRWTSARGHILHRLDLPSLNYVYMPWISSTFREDYLESDSYRSALIRYAYEDLLILNIAYSQSYSSSRGEQRVNRRVRINPYQLQWSIESAGNLLYALASPLNLSRNETGQYSMFNVAFAQYLKLDFSYSKHYILDARNTLALHGAFGIAQPYGNSTIVPFEKRYFGGGANGVRGWSVRELGPGNYMGEDGKVDFINQTGNLRLLGSIELRSNLFWKLSGALFADAGNIWTTRYYDTTGKGGQFQFNKFWKQLAASYGIGFRFNLDYFILRFDMAMKAINPAYSTSERRYLPLTHPRLSRDFTFHFAVGLPF